MRQRLRLVFIGFGAINSRVADLLKARNVPVDITAVATRDDPTERARIPPGVPFLASRPNLPY
jgi:aspartate dehydrogenase